MKTKINVAVFTAIRSEYGLLLPLLKRIRDENSLNLQLLVGGAHMLPEFGNTQEQIIKDGFTPAAYFPFLPLKRSENYEGMALANLSQQLSDYLAKSSPDLMIVLGDRYELLAVANVCLVMNIPIAHISGGDVTEGSIDNQVRNALTKMSCLHFPATEIGGANIRNMGEEEWRIHVSGEPGLDQLKEMTFIQKENLFEEIHLDKNKKTILCTFHPETIDNKITREFVHEMITSLAALPGFQLVLTASGSDKGSTEINETLKKLSFAHLNISFFESLGQTRYYSLLRCCDCMVGNSSSSLVEAQSFEVPAVDVGKRQQGRLANINVIHSKAGVKEVMIAMEKALSPEFKKSLKGSTNIYGDGSACERIMKVLLDLPDKNKLLIKKSTF